VTRRESEDRGEQVSNGYQPASDQEGLSSGADLAGARLAHIAVRSTFWVGLGSYLNQIIGFSAVLVMTRLFSPEIFGYFSLGTFWSSLLNLRPKVGLHYAAINEPKTDGTLLGTYLVIDVIVALLSMILSLIASLVLWAAGYAREVSITLLVLVTFDSLAAVFGPLSMVLEKELQLSRLALVTLIASVVAYSCAIAMALSGMGIRALLAINGLMMVVSMVGIVWTCYCRFPQLFVWKWDFSSEVAYRLLRRGIPVGLSLTALSAVFNQFDNFLIGTFVGYSVLGYYDRAYRIATWPHLLLTMVIGRVAFVTFAKVKQDRPRLTYAVRLSLWVLLALGIPIVLTLFFGARDIVSILYGPAWLASIPFLKFLTLYAFIWPIVNLGLWLSVALGHSRVSVKLTLAQAVTLVAVATPLTLWLGVIGTLIGVAATMLLALSLSLRYIFTQLPLSAHDALLVPCLAGTLTAALMSSVTMWSKLEQLSPLMRLVAIGVSCSGVFFGLLYILRPAETSDRFRYLWRRLVTRSAEWGNSR